jgi:hypothetical protein
MYISETERLNEIVKILQNSKSGSKVGEFVLYKIDDNTIAVNGYSNSQIISKITKEIATKEFYEIKNNFKQLMKEAKLFLEYSKDKTLVYELLMDYGNGAILICKEENGELVFSL